MLREELLEVGQTVRIGEIIVRVESIVGDNVMFRILAPADLAVVGVDASAEPELVEEPVAH